MQYVPSGRLSLSGVATPGLGRQQVLAETHRLLTWYQLCRGPACDTSIEPASPGPLPAATLAMKKQRPGPQMKPFLSLSQPFLHNFLDHVCGLDFPAQNSFLGV